MAKDLLMQFVATDMLPERVIQSLALLVALVAGLKLVNAAIGETTLIGAKLGSTDWSRLGDEIALALHAALDWPELPKRTWRPASLPHAFAAIGPAAVSVICFSCFVVVACVMIFPHDGVTYAAKHYVAAMAFMLFCVTCSRGFMIAAAKQWYGIR